ncbi:TVP38/TMEM64 family protein [Paucibacter sp. DJ2R-2]|uniref:TVP38/TMEM64 family protein n=1 Tax=Paucibacter sp. DJ2R-2 TaxID=2893558 RepID=UPI0021E488B6|nr:VTT domain-containing protein [Paucibacter sp. DJ2R-2]MCV2438572.1 VTT domain-containing protein [Paucibacter sp. DJ2R-2]
MHNRSIRLSIVLVFLALAWAMLRFGEFGEHFTLAGLRTIFNAHEIAGVLIFTALFAAGNLLQIPGWLFLAAAVLALGRVWGGLITYLAACASCLSTFGLIRLLGGDALRQWSNSGTIAKRLFARLDSHPLQSVTALRLMFQTVPALNVALALSGVGWRSYLLGTLIGLPVPILLYALFFDQVAAWAHWNLG